MRLHKCRKVENYLIKEELIDERRIWCYAQAKACVSSQNIYGLALICVKGSSLLMFNTEYNSTDFELVYSCNISNMQRISIKKKVLKTRVSFIIGKDSIQLDLDDWKRFSPVFEGEV